MLEAQLPVALVDELGLGGSLTGNLTGLERHAVGVEDNAAICVQNVGTAIGLGIVVGVVGGDDIGRQGSKCRDR